MGAVCNLYESQVLREITGPAIRPGGLALTERALQFCRLPAGAPVLDVGCGSAETVSHLRCCHDLQALGLDLSSTLLGEARRRSPRPPVIQARAEVLPVADGQLAALFCECVLSLLMTPEAALMEFYRVLGPGGCIVVSDIYLKTAPTAGCRPSGGKCCLNGAVDRFTVLDRVHGAGFEVLLFEDHTPLLRQLAAQLVWAHGSLTAFWANAGLDCETAKPWRGRSGYYLMVAVKSQC